MKRGLSPIITSLIFIGLVVGTIGMIALWQVGILENIFKGFSTEKLCSTVEFRTSGLCREVISESTNFKFDVANDANTSIKGFLIVLRDKEGNTATVSTLSGEEISEQERKQFTTNPISNEGNINEVSIIPQINYNGKIISCENKGEIIPVEEIDSC